jgi:hypothetical protein
LSKNNSNSFKKDIIKQENYFNLDKSVILAGPLKLQEILKNTFKASDGVTGSNRTCLSNLKDSKLKNSLEIFLSPF